MKNLAILTLISLACLSAVLALRLPAGSLLRCQPDVIDFGRVSPGDGLEAKVTLTSRGKSEVKIVRHTSGCSCSGTTIDDSILSPGESTTLNISYSVPKQVRGKKSVAIVIDWRIDEQDYVGRSVVRLQSFVVGNYEVWPADELVFDSDALSKSVFVSSESPDFAVVEVYMSHGGYDVSLEGLEEGDSAANGVKILVERTNSSLHGPAQAAKLNIVTNDKNESLYVLPVFVERANKP